MVVWGGGGGHGIKEKGGRERENISSKTGQNAFKSYFIMMLPIIISRSKIHFYSYSSFQDPSMFPDFSLDIGTGMISMQEGIKLEEDVKVRHARAGVRGSSLNFTVKHLILSKYQSSNI